MNYTMSDIDPPNTESGIVRKQDTRSSDEPSIKRSKLNQELILYKSTEKISRGTGAKGIINLRKEAIDIQYFFDENGYRQVPPYVHEFQIFGKERWIGNAIVDVYSNEFAGESREYYDAAVTGGRITVNGSIVSPHYLIRNGDFLSHHIHRHEVPVSGEDIVIVSENDSIIAVNKPPTMVIHPCGAFRYNSLVCILANIRPDLPELHVCHRLDRLTSGLVVLAKSKQSAGRVCSSIRDGKTSKTYLARVKGDFGTCFPKAFHTDDSMGTLPALYWRHSPAEPDSIGDQHEKYEVSAPIQVVSYQKAQYECHPDGKPAVTFFRKLQYHKNSNSSIVECIPKQGRTHQLRLHLQWLGHPIANDPCYGGELFYDDSVASEKAKIASVWLKKRGYKIRVDTGAEDHDVSNIAAEIDSLSENDKTLIDALKKGLMNEESMEAYISRTCRICSKQPKNMLYSPEDEIQNHNIDLVSISKEDKTCQSSLVHKDYVREMSMQMLMRSNGIWLHALCYKNDEWSYKTELPKWAVNLS